MYEVNLEHRVGTQVTVGFHLLDELFKRKFLPHKSLLGIRFYLIQKVYCSKVFISFHPHRKSIDKKPHGILERKLVSSRNRNAYHDILLAAVLRHQQTENSEKQMKQGNIFTLAELP